MADPILDLTDEQKNVTVDPQVAATQLGNLLHIIAGTGRATDLQTMTTPTSNPTATSTTVAQGASVGPVEGGTPAVSQPFGGEHPGIDLATPVGSHLLAAINGTVTVAGNSDPGGYGNEVEITGPNGLVVRYGHLSSISVKQGDTVTAGQAIGQSGGVAGAEGSGNSTGPHLHFEVRQNGQAIDPAALLAGGAAIVGGGSASNPTPLSPDEILAAQIGNTIDVLAGNQPDNATTGTSEASTISGQTTGADGDPAAIDAFLAATRTHESGGDYKIYNQSGLSDASGAYQFLSSTWKSMGGSTATAAQASPAEQDAIARKMATQLFNKYHSWRLVAIAWYGGPGVADQVAAGKDPGSPQGQGAYLAYGDTIQRMMSGG